MLEPVADARHLVGRRLIDAAISQVVRPFDLGVERTKLTLAVAVGAGHDPVMTTGLVLAHISNICDRTRPDRAQVWRLHTVARGADDPWDHVTRLALRRDTTPQGLYDERKLTVDELARSLAARRVERDPAEPRSTVDRPRRTPRLASMALPQLALRQCTERDNPTARVDDWQARATIRLR